MSSVLALREIAASCDKDFCKKLDKALKIIESALHVYSEQELAFSFNGGKDSTVVLHLLRAVFERATRSGSSKSLAGMKHVYFQTDHEFPEILSFIQECDELYGLKLQTEKGFPEGLQSMVDNHGTRAIFLGTRRTDPDGKYMDGAFTPCTKGWPAVMRINPILHWSYSDVWKLLWGGALCVASPYLAGYTSLGSTQDTAPNPALAVPIEKVQDANAGVGSISLDDAVQCIETNDAVVRQVVALRTAHSKADAGGDCVTVLQHSNGQWYAPAYLLTDSHRERAGRATRPKPGTVPVEGGQAAGAGGVEGASAAVSALRSMQQTSNSRAGIMIIGDEVLSGAVKDTNGPELISALSGAGLSVSRCVIVPDDTHAIARELSTLSQACRVVVTAGGVGPTHDDVTLSAVALAFGVPLEEHAGMKAFLSAWHKCPIEDMPASLAAMALLPRGSVLVTDASVAAAASSTQAAQTLVADCEDSPTLQYPVVLVRNVFVLPGIPSLVRSKIASLVPAMQTPSGRVRTVELVLQANEPDIAQVLSEVAKALSPRGIALGSYPVDNAHFSSCQTEGSTPPTAAALGGVGGLPPMGAEGERPRRASVDILKPSSAAAAVRLVLSGRVAAAELASARQALLAALAGQAPGKWLEVEDS